MERFSNGKVRELFEQALALPVGERHSFLERTCAEDRELRREVEELLEADALAAGFLEEPALVASSSPLAEQALLDEDPAFVAGERIGPYTILEAIGAGGMAHVYAAEQTEPILRRVALKALKRGLDTSRVLARFQAERDLLSAMDHPGIARVLDAGTAPDGRPYLVMELIDGVDLSTWRTSRRRSLGDRLALFVQVAAAVGHAHQKGVVHRDLKPSNILVIGDGPEARAKVIDFGVARALSETDERLTRPGLLIGTPAYMAPEQRDGSGSTDTRMDVYALGLVLYELLTDNLPEKDSGDGLLPPSRRAEAGGARLRDELDWIVMKALEDDPERRYAAVSELKDDVVRFLSGEAVLARAPSFAYRTRKLYRRHRIAFLGGLVSIAATLVALFVTLSSLDRTRGALLDSRRLNDLYELQLLERDALESMTVNPEVPGAITSLLARVDEILAHEDPDRLAAAAREESRASDSSAQELIRYLNLWRREDHGSLRGRLLRHKSLVERTFAITPESQAIWRAARDSIRAHPAYAGLELAPQTGLFPVGPDPESGLWEFVHTPSGEIPQRDEDGFLNPFVGMGIVFVLIPGDSFWFGAENTPEARHGPKPYDPAEEGPSVRVRLDPYFIGKYELTYDQWARIDADYGSKQLEMIYVGRQDRLDFEEPVPAGMITWADATRGLARFGLELPTEARWEYAARGGTNTIFWAGDRTEDIRGLENYNHATEREYLAPIGCFAPNPFGLQDVSGNVFELCSDLNPEGRPRDGDGMREGNPGLVVGRGGSYANEASLIRIANRTTTSPIMTFDSVGIRVARDVEN